MKEKRCRECEEFEVEIEKKEEKCRTEKTGRQKGNAQNGTPTKGKEQLTTTIACRVPDVRQRRKEQELPTTSCQDDRSCQFANRSVVRSIVNTAICLYCDILCLFNERYMRLGPQP